MSLASRKRAKMEPTAPGRSSRRVVIQDRKLPFRLLDLPEELRPNIYRYVLGIEQIEIQYALNAKFHWQVEGHNHRLTIPVFGNICKVAIDSCSSYLGSDQPRNTSSLQPSNLPSRFNVLLTCRKVSEEALQVLYGSTFILRGEQADAFRTKFIPSIGLRNTSCIRSIHMNIPQYLKSDLPTATDLYVNLFSQIPLLKELILTTEFRAHTHRQTLAREYSTMLYFAGHVAVKHPLLNSATWLDMGLQEALDMRLNPSLPADVVYNARVEIKIRLSPRTTESELNHIKTCGGMMLDSQKLAVQDEMTLWRCWDPKEWRLDTGPAQHYLTTLPELDQSVLQENEKLRNAKIVSATENFDHAQGGVPTVIKHVTRSKTIEVCQLPSKLQYKLTGRLDRLDTSISSFISSGGQHSLDSEQLEAVQTAGLCTKDIAAQKDILINFGNVREGDEYLRDMEKALRASLVDQIGEEAAAAVEFQNIFTGDEDGELRVETQVNAKYAHSGLFQQPTPIRNAAAGWLDDDEDDLGTGEDVSTLSNVLEEDEEKDDLSKPLINGSCNTASMIDDTGRRTSTSFLDDDDDKFAPLLGPGGFPPSKKDHANSQRPTIVAQRYDANSLEAETRFKTLGFDVDVDLNGRMVLGGGAHSSQKVANAPSYYASDQLSDKVPTRLEYNGPSSGLGWGMSKKYVSLSPFDFSVPAMKPLQDDDMGKGKGKGKAVEGQVSEEN